MKPREGDKVLVDFGPDEGLAPGTVLALDVVPMHPGVRVGLDRFVNGLSTCYATYRECIVVGVPHARV